MSSSSPLVAENYHLKWDSHLTNLNLSLTSLFKTERFADVMLLSSHSDCLGGPAIPAHKIILSSCSSFFSTIFTNQLAQNGLMYIMLPPELSYRCIKILVQYMYSGESTVSNDILNEVLRGGEILKIRGLYKNRNKHTNQRSCTPNYGKSPSHQSPLPSLPKESPVIIKLPNKSAQKITSIPLPNIEKGTITVKKNIAIDPEVVTRSSDLLQTASNNCTQKKSLPSSSSCNNKELVLTNVISIEQKNLSNSNEKLKQCEPSTSGLSISQKKTTESTENIKEKQSVETKIDNIMTKNKNTEADNSKNLLILGGNNIKKENDIIDVIKEEPMDWNPSNGENSTSSSQKEVKPPPPLIDKIKIEKIDPDVTVSDDDENIEDYEIFEVDDDNDNDNDPDNYAPLECEICNQKFGLPKDWVRHIETHMETTSTTDIPKKKQKVMKKDAKEKEDDSPILHIQCDLCLLSFEPGDWVRHIENEHTERELATINRKFDYKLVKENYDPRRKFDSYLNKTCDICNESFPTYAKMIIHYRTHVTKQT